MANDTVVTMAERILLDDSVAREIEEQLFATLRQQTNRPVPVLLPHKDFWERVAQLLDTIEMKVHEIYRTRGPDLRLQNLQKRQANIRRTASDLARKRLVAMLQHAASTSLRSEGGLQNSAQELAALDWGRHDPAEREFYSNVIEQISRFKQNVGWKAMQHGLSSEGMPQSAILAAGTSQLDSFVEEAGGLTGQGPPQITVEDKLTPLVEEYVDEEEVLAKQDAYPELEGVSLDQSSNEQSSEPMASGSTHAAASELAPSKEKEEHDFNAWADAEAASTEEPVTEIEPEIIEKPLLRIRVLQTMDEPIITIDGELSLEAGDVHFLEDNMANYLVSTGVAEIAEL